MCPSPITSSDYIPQDSGCTVASLESLYSDPGRHLLDMVRAELAQPGEGRPGISTIERWRRDFSPDLVHTAIVVAKCDIKAAAAGGKFAEYSGGNIFWAVPEALEQATSTAVAQYKAEKLKRLLPQTANIFDICCGIGGDTLALVCHAPVQAWEISPVRAWMARHNLQAAGGHPVCVHEEDILTADIPHASGCAFHFDPARRTHGGRQSNSRLYPDPLKVLAKLAACEGGMMKLSPANDFATLPAGHLEIISENGSVVQALLWLGKAASELNPALRTATIIGKKGEVWSMRAEPAPPTRLHQPGGWIFEINGAVTRAGLAAGFLQEIGLEPLTVDGGYATGAEAVHHAAVAAFEILAVIPYSEKNIVERLKKMPPGLTGNSGIVEVKTRGGLGLDTDRLQRNFRRASGAPVTLLIYPSGGEVTAVIARRRS